MIILKNQLIKANYVTTGRRRGKSRLQKWPFALTLGSFSAALVKDKIILGKKQIILN